MRADDVARAARTVVASRAAITFAIALGSSIRAAVSAASRVRRRRRDDPDGERERGEQGAPRRAESSGRR